MTASSAPKTDKVVCTAFGPNYWSPKDTDKSIAWAKEYNAAWTAICGKPQSSAKQFTARPPAAKSAGTTFKDRWYEGVKTYATVFR